MTKTKDLVMKLVRTALAVSLAMSMMMASRAAAQVAASNPGAAAAAAPAPSAAPASNQTATVERIIVTGSNIPTAEEVGPNPVLNINRDMIRKSGERNTEELLRNLAVAGANGVPVSNNENGSNTAVGAATIALRSFDAR